MDRRTLECQAFVISSKIYLEDSLALSCLTSKGLIFCYDHYFFKNYQNSWPYLKECYFSLRLVSSLSHTKHYLKKMTPLSQIFLQGQDLELWAFFSDFVFFYCQYPEYSHHFYSFYHFLYHVMLKNTASQERKYFYYTYTFFHILDRCREGHFLGHCREMLQGLSEQEQKKWQEDFSAQSVSFESFQKVLSYLRIYCYNHQQQGSAVF